jgi:hypothetical protein
MSSPFSPARTRAALLAALCALLPAAAGAQAHTAGTPPPRALAAPLTGPVQLDGRLDEAVWRSAAPATGFTQQDPDEGRPATQRTEVRFAYDDEALYVGARMFDSLGAAGVRTRLVRRDADTESDYVQLVLDTYHDHTGRTVIQVNPSGVKYDAGQASPYADPSWDPVWEAATEIDSLGWTAELRIPLSQLRFPRDSVQTWGVQVWRYVQRLNESSMWSFWGKNESGGPSRFGHVEGLRLKAGGRRVEVLPYLVARTSYVDPASPGSPFEERHESDLRLGADVKALLTSTLTLDATINPDFGQVEVDPAVVNLSAFETFYDEKRPFFVEGSGLFDYGGFNCYFCNNVSGLTLFYSRRIGRSPQGVVTRDADFTRLPENSAILAAAKVTGRTAGGLQVGLLDAVTRSERALGLSPEGTEFEEEVEPFTNYFVGRVRRNYRGGNTTVGAIATSVARRFDSDPLSQRLATHAEAVGVDWETSWKSREYMLMGNFSVSSASGDSLSIGRLQRSSARYFQRPDRDGGGNAVFSDGYDPGATGLRGYSGYLRMAKESGSWLWEAHTMVRSPGFEANDLGFVSRSDFVWLGANLARQSSTPTRFYRRVTAIVGGQRQYNFDGDATEGELHAYVGGQLPNYWDVSTFAIVTPESHDDRMTRGGPLVRRPGYYFHRLNVNTDSRKPIVFSTSPGFSRDGDGAVSYDLNLSVRVKPASNVQLSVGPGYSFDESRAGFVDRFDDPTAGHFFGQRVVFADLEQHTVAMDTRLNWTFSPTLTLELFAQPFVSSGSYTGFKEFVAPRTTEKREFDAAQVYRDQEDGGYVLDPDRDPSTENFTFGDPDFNFRSLRGNAVLRWEYRPGSTVFLVWQQQRSGAQPYGDFDFSRDSEAVFQQRPDNIFVVKLSYWFGR